MSYDDPMTKPQKLALRLWLAQAVSRCHSIRASAAHLRWFIEEVGEREAISHVLVLTVVLSTAITDLGPRGPLDCYVFY